MQQPSNLRRCGEMFIKFGTDGQPEYGFTYDAYHRTLTKFYDLQNVPESTLNPAASPVKRLELPLWDLPKSPVKVDNQAMLAAQQDYATARRDPDGLARQITLQTLKDYAKGGVRLARGCFHGLPNLQLTLSGNYSVMLDWGCFDNKAKVELVLPNDMTLKQVNRTFDTAYDYEHEDWTLVAHRDFNWQGDYARDSYRVRDFRPDDSRCQFSISHPAKLSTCTVTPVYANLKLHPYHRPTAQDYRVIDPADNSQTL